ELLRLRSRFSDRECSWIFCAAECFNWTEVAFRFPRYANDRAKIEECGIENRGIGFWNKIRCMLPEPFPTLAGIARLSKIEKPRQNASNVRIDDGDGLIKSEAGHGVCGVLPDAWELLHFLDCVREGSAVSIHNRFGCVVKISRASVIAE